MRKTVKPSRPILHFLVEDMRRWGLVDKNRELELVNAMKEGDAKAREELICANTRIAVKIARAFSSSGLPIEDLTSAAMKGMIRAIDKYTPGKSKLTYFITIYARGELIDLMTRNRCLVQVGTTLARQKCANKLDVDADARTEAERLNVPLDVVVEMQGRLRGEISLDEPAGDSNDRVVDTMAVEAPSTLETIERREQHAHLWEAVKKANLKPLQLSIIDRHIVEGENLRTVAKSLKTPFKTCECELASALLTLRQILVTHEAYYC